MNLEPILEALQKATYAYGKKAVAADAGCSAQYLGRVLNPTPEPDEVKHIHLRTALQIMETTKDTTALVLMASELGLTTSKAPVPDKATSREECADDIKSLADMQLAMAEGASASIVHTLACRACDEIRQTAVLYTKEMQRRMQ